MRPVSNRPARLYASAKTHKFDNINDVNLDQLKFRPIMDQTGTYTYNTAQVISNYLKPLCTNEYSIKDTLQFPQLLKDLPPLKDDEEYVSYDVESLFTNIPLKETIDYILEQIYVHNKLPIICSKLIFRRLLEKITTENTFQLNSKFFKQTDGCAMGGPLSVTLSDIWMVKMENNIVIPHKPIFYKRYVDDIINRRKKHEEDLLFKKLNDYHPKIKLTIEINPPKFLETEIIILNNEVVTSVHRKESKLPVPWESKVPKHYKRNTLLGELHRAKKISSNFQKEVKNIKEKFNKANFPLRFINNVVTQFNKNMYNNKERNEEDEMIIPPQLFEIPKKILFLQVPFCEANEKRSKNFLNKFYNFTNEKFKLIIRWRTRNLKSLFPLKDKDLHPACKIYKGICSCESTYVGETKRNVEVRYSEHNHPSGKSEPSKHLYQNINHVFTWSVICSAPKIDRTRKNLEAFYIALMRSNLNEQCDSNVLTLFRNGIT